MFVTKVGVVCVYQALSVMHGKDTEIQVMKKELITGCIYAQFYLATNLLRYNLLHTWDEVSSYTAIEYRVLYSLFKALAVSIERLKQCLSTQLVSQRKC